MPKIKHGQHNWKTHREKAKRKSALPKKKRGFPKKLPKNLIKNLILFLIALAVFGSICLLGVFAYISRDLPDPNNLSERAISQSTKIYDRTGEHLLYEIHGEENRTLVKLADTFCHSEGMELDQNGIPLHALQATIAAEDRQFCEHHGFSIKGIARAVRNNILGGTGGGSTLTQQLVKNAILTGEKKISRKIKELILSIEIERRYSKDEILQIYFNEIPYGSTNYGIEAAAHSYFGKSVGQISVSEAAVLAALPQRPTTLLNNPDLLKDRRDWILQGMLDLGFISRDEFDAAVAEEINISQQITDIAAPHFVFYVKEILEEKYGQRQVEEGGLKVITSLDLDKQNLAETVVKEGVEANSERYGFSNASLVAIDPKTGQVLAMVGSKDYFDETIDGQVNVALRNRQPGSSFKPIVYTAGFEAGYTPNTVLWDVKTNFPTSSGNYSPNNYDLGQRGPVTVRTALQGSLNIPAVKMLYLVGVDKALDFAEELGYTTFQDRSNFGLAIVLGGAEVKLVEHTNAYAAFANEGQRHDITAILKVEDADGNVLEEWKENEGERVVSENIARTITNVLSDNGARAYVFGTGSALSLGARPVAAKTGTTNDYRDAWLVGYTPSLAVGVWAGNNDNSEMARGAGGSTVAGPIWNEYMKRVLENEPIENFNPPSIKATGNPMLDGQIPSETVTIDKASGKLATEYTPSDYKEEKTFAEYHTILHFVDKGNVLGGIPEDPAKDPYYEKWEEGVQAWIAAKEEETGIEIEQGLAPDAFDDVHIPENIPTISIETPSNNDEFESRQIQISVNAGSPRGVSGVEFYIDGFYLGSDTVAPFSINTKIPNTIERGYHTIKAIAYDDVDNTGSESIGIRITSTAEATDFELIDPNNGQTIQKTKDTYIVVVSVKNPAAYSSVSVYGQEIGGGAGTLIDSIESPTSPFLTFTWTLPDSGDWALTAQATSDDNETLETAGIVVHVIPTKNDGTEKETEEEEETEEELNPEVGNLNPFANLPPEEPETTEGE